ncbi:polyprenyl synthetase family protein [Desulfotomaculum copahuensis]|uniref:Polyprenyl synthetase n=1 Tax=Desulfotomaculum copahuensis TaxID=1838280 RepID=A0A1B7LH65_9FIRM|nr:polyprenyl synthetase family protein [Desulfotomaculum copahuensis]OAT85487.1 hypothetical protein A6M21_06110 [Desulfotomaculum copahuensis]
MLSRILSPIQNELFQVEGILEKSFQIKTGHLSSFAHLQAGTVNAVIRPALVLLSAGMYGPLTSPVIALAAVVQFIYLAAMIHGRINEEDPRHATADRRDGYQFPVLVGDYLYGRFFTSLCDAGIVRYLEPLSETICRMNEGSILRLKNSVSGKNNPGLWLKIIRLETASLTAAACSLGCRLTGAPPEEAEIWNRFGRHFGTALALLEDQAPGLNGGDYLALAAEELSLLPPGETQNICKLLLNYFQDEAAALSRQVV